MVGPNVADGNRDSRLRLKARKDDLEARLRVLLETQRIVKKDLEDIEKGDPLRHNELYGLRPSEDSHRLSLLLMRTRVRKYSEEVDKRVLELNAQIKEIDRLMESTLNCPTCGGRGEVISSTSEREDGQLIERVTGTTCQTCGGSGLIET